MSVLNSVVSSMDKLLDHITRPVYYMLFGTLYFLYIVIFFGLFYINTKYVRMWIMIIQIFIALVLIIRFNPIRQHTLTKTDSDIIFSCGIFLLLNSFLAENIMSYLSQHIHI